MPGKSQASLTYVVLQPTRNKYFNYFPSSTFRMMFFCFKPQSFPLGLSFTQCDLIKIKNKKRLFQRASLWMKSLVNISSPIEQDLQSHQGDLQKNKHTPFFKSVVPSELNDRFTHGKCTQAYFACTN